MLRDSNDGSVSLRPNGNVLAFACGNDYGVAGMVRSRRDQAIIAQQFIAGARDATDKSRRDDCKTNMFSQSLELGSLWVDC